MTDPPLGGESRVRPDPAVPAVIAPGPTAFPRDHDVLVVQHSGVWKRLWRAGSARVSIVLLAAIVFACSVGPVVTGHSPTAIEPNNQFQGPSSDHLLGTDALGRDTLTRTMVAGRLALAIAMAGTLFAIAVGGLWGAIAAHLGGLWDSVLMRVVDVMLSIPLLLFALILVAALGSDPTPLALILGILHTPWTARVMRTAVRGELIADYCAAARSFGTGRVRLLLHEVLPNLMPTLLVQATLVMASIMLAEAALSFVGLGAQPPRASWGTLLLQGYQDMSQSLWLVMVPGVALFVTVFAVSTVGNCLQAALNPRKVPIP